MSRKKFLIPLAAVLAFVLTACPADPASPATVPDGVSAVTVSAGLLFVEKGKTLQFGADVTATGSASRSVSWKVFDGETEISGDGETKIDNTGLLSVKVGEIRKTLTVKASSEFDSTKSGSVTVTVLGNPETIDTTAAEFDEKINEIKNIPGEYIINLTEDLLDCPRLVFDNPLVKITLKSESGTKTISCWSAYEKNTLLVFVSGILTLENIVLNIKQDNPQAGTLIGIFEGGIVEMKDGAVLDGTPAAGQTVQSGVWVYDGSFIMSGGTIRNCSVGADVGDNAVKASITITGGTITGNKTGTKAGGKNAAIAISGGTISGNETGVGTGGKNAAFVISGNASITGNETGVGLWDTSEDCAVTISGGTISDNTDAGISINGKNATVTVSGDASINGNKDGIGLWDASENCALTINGGTISDNNMRNISFDGLDNELAMTGGTLVQQPTGRENVLIEGSGNSFTMSGGEIIRTLTDLSSVLMRGSNISFSKNSGGIISSDSGRVVRVTSPSATLLARYAAIPSGESLSAITNAAGDGIASKSGAWDE